MTLLEKQWMRLAAAAVVSAGLVACDAAQNGAQESADQTAASAEEPAEAPAPDTVEPAEEGEVFADTLQELLLDAQPGDVIEIPEGVHHFERSLSLAVDGVTLRGAGMDKSILSFKNQVAGAEGLLVTASNFLIEDLAIEDTKGDGLKINEGENITIRRVRAEWTNGPSTENGAYGLYPVQTHNVLVEDCVAIGASDAGIYVGQSTQVVVRNNRAEYNVAGIEIENTVGADVYGNLARNNTGGILVFNMPNLPQEGHSTRVYQNNVTANNTENFAAAGTPVATVPAGTGVIVTSNDKVEIFDNDITDNKTGNILITSVYSSDLATDGMVETFDPFPETILIADNRFAGGGDAPDVAEMEALRVAMFGEDGRLPDVMWDGFVNPETLVDGVQPEGLRVCIDNGDAMVLNLDAPNGFAAPSMNPEFHACSHERLESVTLSEW